MEHLEMSDMNRGDVYWVNFDPAVGSEIQKKRPAVIVSNNLNNMYGNLLLLDFFNKIEKYGFIKACLIALSKNSGQALSFFSNLVTIYSGLLGIYAPLRCMYAFCYN